MIFNWKVFGLLKTENVFSQSQNSRQNFQYSLILVFNVNCVISIKISGFETSVIHWPLQCIEWTKSIQLIPHRIKNNQLLDNRQQTLSDVIANNNNYY